MLRSILILLSFAATIAAGGGATSNEVDSSSFWIHGAAASYDIPPFRQLQKIVGGEYANTSEFPWFAYSQVKIEQLNEAPIFSFCGGSFIHSDIAISAAFCVVDSIRNYPRDTTNITVELIVGLNITDLTYVSRHKVSEIIWPRSYVDFENDIVFYKLFNSTSIPPVPWNTDPSIPLVGDIGTAIGYGDTTRDGGLFSNTSLKADLSVISNAECRAEFGRLTFGRFVDESEVCAFTLGKSTCTGDLGGPIITQNGVLFGLYAGSYSFSGCDERPNVFTRVSSYDEMIASVSRDRRKRFYCALFLT